ncbi:hypothetical protein ACHWQZ_G011808 [Mnemiopsis leidyi]
MKPPDSHQWDGVTEDSLFLNDGLLRVADLISIPPEICSADSASNITWDVETSIELSSNQLAKQIEKMYCYKSSSYQRFQDYRLCALKGFWESLKSEQELEPTVSSTSIAMKTQNSSPLPFTSRVSLLLIFPLLEVQSASNPELCKSTSKLLIDCLKDCKPLSLANEPQDCLDGLENLLCKWINDEKFVGADQEKACLASTLVILACARGSIRMMLSTLHTVQKLNCPDLDVCRMLRELLETSGGPGVPTSLNGSLHHLCWDHSDVISVPADINSSKENNKTKEVPRTLGTDGKYLYMTGCTGAGLARIGTGRAGTLRGVVYARNLHIEQGWVTFADGNLIYRTASADTKNSPFCQLLNPSTLQIESDVHLTGMSLAIGNANNSTTTLALSSDGLYIYWITCSSVVVRSGPSKSNKSLTIFVDVLNFEKNEAGSLVLVPVKDRITIQRKDIEASKTLTEALIEKLRPVRSSSANMALEAIQLLAATAKDDNAQTSCGLTLKVLRKTPMYTCGNHLVMVIPTSSNSRSGQPSALFVPALSVSGPTKGIATSLCFSLSDGQLDQRVDLSDAPGCALAKGSSLCSMGACYDVENNTIWTCSDEWVEEWGNPGNMAPHHIARRLGVVPIPSPDSLISMNDVVTILLHHLGSTCCHQINTEQKLVPDMTPRYLEQLSDILNSVTQNEQQLHCVLVLLNLSMQSLDTVTSELVDSITILREQVWKILSSNYSEAILKAASKILSNSFELFYSSEESQHIMVVELIKSSQHVGCQILQTSVFSHIRAQLDSSLAQERSAWCAQEIVDTVFGAATAESCTLIGNVVTLSNDAFQSLVSHMPQRSPCISLLGSIQSHLFRYSLSHLDDKDTTTELFNYVKFSLQQCRKVYDTVLSVCTGLDELETVHVETRLNMFERLIKSSILGLILPPMLCLLCDRKLHSLGFSENLLQMLSDVSVVACKAATAVHDKMKLLSSDPMIIEEGAERPGQFQEYLSSLSVPAPWAAGRTVETIHPVRDNYKFKDTVTIPGARSLYLRFDPRCATQYDYDKVIIYAGASTSSRKVAEYGGNTYGFGSRSVLGSGWPTDQIKVEGDTVTFSFEMRSGREHNTPDRAIWGFACSVRAQESAEEDMLGMPVLADTALGLSTLSCHALRVLYEGPPASEEEILCKDLMESRLLQRCVWKEANVGSLIRDTGVTSPIVDKLRIMCGKPGPVFRPSLKTVVQPEEIEIAVIAAAMKHLRFELNTENLELDNDTASIVNKVLARLNAMLRKLQNLAELEQRWDNEKKETASSGKSPSEAFFVNFHLTENKMTELEMLCFITGAKFDEEDPESSVKELIVLVGEEKEKEDMSKTKWLLGMLRERLSVLMSVDVITDPVFDRTTSLAHVVQEQESEVEFNRSISAPSLLEGKHEEDAVLIRPESRTVAQDLQKLRKKKREEKKNTGYNVTGTDEESTGPVDELFKFIGCDPNKAISCETFLSAAKLRHTRGKARSKALRLMHQLLTKADQAKSVTHLVQDIAMMLRCGPRCEELYCGGMTEQVRHDFSSTLQLLVKLTASHLVQCSETVALICIIPFSRTDDACLLTSGLLKLIDTLLAGSKGTNRDVEAEQQISTVAWAGFRVLAHRCTSWESQDQSWEISALASQVAMVLTNHLARAIDSAGVQDTTGNDILHNVLSLLLKLSKTRLGQAIISQAVCISHLLYLLVDHRPSPKLVLTVLQLLRLALPLLSSSQSGLVSLPTAVQGDSAATNIIHLLVDKLGEYLVPGSPAETVLLTPPLASPNTESRTDPCTQDPNKVISFNQRVTVYIHKRPNQQPHEVIQPLISADTRLFSQTTYMEKIIQMDRSMSQTGKAELLTDEFRVCARKAAKWAASGFIISIEPPAADDGQGEQRHHNTEHLCYEKNKEILRTDPVRPFISGQVASSLASKVISLLHALLTSSSSVLWAKAIEQVLGSSLSKGSELIKDLKNTATGSSSTTTNSLLKSARRLMAVLAALGGFKEYIRTGSHVQVKGEVITEGVVTALSERQGVASVLDDKGVEMSCPMARLMPPRKEVLPIDSLDITTQLVEMLHKFIKLALPPEPTSGDASSPSHVACRILAELKTRAFMVLSLEVRDPAFADEFLNFNNDITETMSSIAHLCTSGNRLAVIEALCEHLRMVYHDCAHPPPPPVPKKQPQMIQTKWESNCDYPTVRGTIFSQYGTCLHFLGDVTPPPGQPKGVLIYANSRIPSSATSYYYEIQLLQSGDTPDEQGGNIVSFGFAPPPPSNPTSSWTNPSGTVLFHSNGRAYHYCGPTILAWKSVRLNVSVKVGDIAGIGWTAANPAVGRVYFTLNGTVLQGEQQDVPAGLFPVIHIHRKGVRVRANFGTMPFKYTPCETPNDGTPAVSPAASEERLSEILPIGAISETESESESVSGGVTTSRAGSAAKIPVHDAPQQLPMPEYNTSTSSKCKLPPGYTALIDTGPNTKGSIVDDEEAVLEEEVEEQRQDHYALLVRAWEAKVFPVIRRRFRNEQERRSGLEQIKGALLLGMTEIACQTVDFLYEDNGGRPKDLVLPTLDDIKEDLAKFTIDRIRTGMTVVIKPDPNEGNKFSVRGMHYTYGLHGIVLAVDYSNELVQVETYLRQEGILVRYWYPLSVLERPIHHQMSAASTCNVDVKDCVVHRQMLYHENILANLYCRSALLALIENPRPFFKLPRQLSSRATSHTTSPTDDQESCSSSSVSLPLSGFTSDNLEPPNTEYVNMLSKELLRGPQPNGTVPPLTESCSRGSRQVLDYNSLIPSRFFYSNSSRLKDALHKMISNSVTEECSLMSLTARFCKVLNESPNKFTMDTVRLTDMKASYDVKFNNAAYIFVSCRITSLDEKSSDNFPKCPWIRVFAHNGIQGLARDGQPLRQEVVHYPHNSTTYSTAYQEPAAVSVQSIARFPTVMIPFDRVHVRTISSSPSPPVQVHLHSIPAEFCIAMSYIETLIEVATTDHCPTSILLYCAEAMSKVLVRVDLVPSIKELLFHSLAELIRLIPTSTPALVFPSTKLKPFQAELLSLFSHEMKANGVGKKREVNSLKDYRMSTYFQGLVELVFALREIIPEPLTSPKTEPGPEDESRETEETKSSPLVKRSKSGGDRAGLTKRRKLRVKQRGRDSTKSPPDLDSDSGQVQPWFDMALNCNLMLRHVIDKNPRGSEGVRHSLCQLRESLSTSTPTARLIVICGLPTFYSRERVETTINRLCCPYGGVVEGEVFVPSHHFPLPPSSKDEQLCKGVAVLQLNCFEKMKEVVEVLQENKFLKGDVSGSNTDNNRAYCVVTLGPDLICSSDNSALISSAVELYATNKLLNHEGSLNTATQTLLSNIFSSCPGKSPLSKAAYSNTSDENMLCPFTTLYEDDLVTTINTIYKEHGEKANPDSEELYLSTTGFLNWATEVATSRPVLLLRCILATGHDLQYNLLCPADSDYLSKLNKFCSVEVDRAVVRYVNRLCKSRGVSSNRIFPQEILMTSSDRSDPELAALFNVPIEYLRLRFAFLQLINTSVSKHLLPAVSLGAVDLAPHSIGSVLLRGRDLLFYDVKLGYLNFVINSTDRRSGDSVPPEIIFDPLTFVHQTERALENTITMLAKQQLSRTPSSEMCVKLAAGGDPIFPFNVKLTGENVAGTSGSFRYFMWLVAQELQSSSLPVLIECPSASAGENKGKYLLAPKNIDYHDEALLLFFGNLLGVAMRSDVPFAVDCLRPFWTRILGEQINLDTDLRQSDIITYNFLKGLKSLSTETEFKELVGKTCPTHFTNEECCPGCPYKFSYASLDGRDVELRAGSPLITWSNLAQFIESVQELRSCELSAKNMIPVIQCGLEAVVPLEPLRLMGADDLQLRVCGQQNIDIGFIKLHTIYQVGISQSDKHIEYFWNVVESLSQEDLRKLIKFACNQERIPFSCPCQENGPEASHVPPYPMKIAPAEGRDDRLIRSETCMFMIKLPQYSSESVMRERILQAINCRDDPLSG